KGLRETTTNTHSENRVSFSKSSLQCSPQGRTVLAVRHLLSSLWTFHQDSNLADAGQNSIVPARRTLAWCEFMPLGRLLAADGFGVGAAVGKRAARNLGRR